MLIKCKICGCMFPASAETHYVARDNERVDSIAAFQPTFEAVIYDAFDCPLCGCQSIMQERKYEIEIEKLEENANE